MEKTPDGKIKDSDSDDLWNNEVTFLEVPLYSMGVIAAYAELTCFVGVNGEVSFTASYTIGQTVTCRNGTKTVDKRPGESHIETNASVSVSAGIKLKANVRVGFSTFGSLSLAAKVAELEFTFAVDVVGETTSPWGPSDQPRCADVSVNIRFTMEGKLGLIDWTWPVDAYVDEMLETVNQGNSSAMYISGTFIEFTVPIWQKHWEGRTREFTDACAKDNLVTVTFVHNHDGKTDKVYVEKGSRVSQVPPVDEREGYTFRGWYTDSSSSPRVCMW